MLPDWVDFLGTMFVDPDYQNRAVGPQAWQLIEAAYPQTRDWTLGTPKWAIRNHFFYQEKCGFTKIGEQIEEKEGCWFTCIKRKWFSALRRVQALLDIRGNNP